MRRDISDGEAALYYADTYDINLGHGVPEAESRELARLAGLLSALTNISRVPEPDRFVIPDVTAVADGVALEGDRVLRELGMLRDL